LIAKESSGDENNQTKGIKMKNQRNQMVKAYYIKDGDEDLACGKCRSIIYSDETICPVCGATNDINNAVHVRARDIFPAV
jgi:predicted amidophosphoribosyltransferase